MAKPIVENDSSQAPRGWPAGRPWEGSGWLSVAQARTAPGLRITDSPYWAALWAQILRGILYVKKIPYAKVVHPPFSGKDPEAQRELFAWTAQTSVPTMVYNDGSDKGDVVKNDWLNQLMLAEQISPEPALIPQVSEDRVLMIGLAHELMSPQGLMWNGRLAMRELHDTSNLTPRQRDFFTPENFLGGKYSYNGKSAPLENIRSCLRLLDEQLKTNQAGGSKFFIGQSLSALDIYWMYASIMVKLLPPEEMPVMEVNRAMYPAMNEALEGDLTPRLLEHRNFIFHELLQCPMEVD